jgi:AAA domain-containing protein
MAIRLEDFATEMVARNRFIKAAFAGFAGSGKSTTATDFVIGAYHEFGYTKPILVIDNEEGSRFLIPKFRKANIKAMLKVTTNVDDVLTAIDLLNDGAISFLFADTLTKVWYRFVRDYLEKNRKSFMELNDWGKVIPKWQEVFADRFVAAQGSIVFTGRGGFEYEKEEDTRDETGRLRKGQFVKSGVKMKMAGETPFEPDLNVWMSREEEFQSDGSLKIWRQALIMKDRSSLIDGKVFVQPTYDDFQPFVRYLVDVETGNVSGQSSDRNLSPGENFDGYDRKVKKEVALEEIAEELNKMHPGSTDAAKVARKELLEKVFNTRSWKAVEIMAPQAVFDGRDKIWRESRGHGYGEQPPEKFDDVVPMGDAPKESAA